MKTTVQSGQERPLTGDEETESEEEDDSIVYSAVDLFVPNTVTY